MEDRVDQQQDTNLILSRWEIRGLAIPDSRAG
jgi:hypothetical protein